MLKGYKTYILAVLGVLASLVGFITGDITAAEFLGSPNVILLFNALAAATLRHSIPK